MWINRGYKRTRSSKMSQTLSESSWKSKDAWYSATTSKNMLLKKKTKQQQWAMAVVHSTANFTLCLDPALHITDLCQDDTVADEEWINK